MNCSLSERMSNCCLAQNRAGGILFRIHNRGAEKSSIAETSGKNIGTRLQRHRGSERIVQKTNTTSESTGGWCNA